MKRTGKLLSVLLLAGLCAALLTLAGFADGDVEINRTNFPDPVFRSYVSGSDIDKNQDGVLSAGEIASVTSMSLGQKGISDLTGIGYFSALQTMFCYRNNLQSLDVSGCAALHSLICYENNLSSLDVSRNTDLQRLNCIGNNLTSLNVSGCADLISLYCDENSLSSLDVSGCAGLRDLSCGKNSLSSLDMSGCPAMQLLMCEDNDLTSLDVNGCPALVWLVCYENKLASLDISECPTLVTAVLNGTKETDNGHILYHNRNDGARLEFDELTVLLTSPTPGAIATVTATSAAGVNTVTWSASENAETYIIQRRTQADGVWGSWATIKAGVTGTTYQDAKATAGALCQYRVRGRNASGTGPFKTSGSVRTTAVRPGAISAVTAKATADKITVTWTASANAKTYQIQRQTYGESAWTTVKSGLTGLTYTDNAVKAGTKVRYRVRGKNDAGWGSFKVSSYVTALAKPGAISSVTVKAANGVTVTWTASSNAKTYLLQRQVYGSDAWTTVKNGLTDRSYADTAVKAGTKVRYRVRGVNEAGPGAFKVSSYVTAAAAKPGAISSLTATVTAGKITLKWTASSGASTYLVQRRAYQNGAWGNWSTVVSANKTLTCTDSKVTKGTKYQYRVRGNNAAGAGSFKTGSALTAK